MKIVNRITAAVVTMAALCLHSWHPGFAQTSVSHSGITDPPEMVGPPPPPYVQNPVDNEFFDTLNGVSKFTQENIAPLEAFIAKHPDYDDALYSHGDAEACTISPPDFYKALADFAIILSRTNTGGKVFKNRDIAPKVAKIQMSQGHTSLALETMYTAMKADLDSADTIFNIQAVKPTETTGFCNWNLNDIATLQRFAPKDWRPVAFEGLYYFFFTSFDESYYAQTLSYLQKAAALAPTNAVIPYLLGEVYAKQGFLTTKAVSSDAARSEILTRAAQAFSRAILLDPKFILAYYSRAEARISLKQNAAAIKDFDVVLAAEPDKLEAYSDRGLAEMNAGKYYPAITDFGSSISRRPDTDSYLHDLYESRADAYIAVGDVRRAISDYSAAIRYLLRSQVPVFSLEQVRGLYGEYSALDDDTLLEKLRKEFAPTYEQAAFKKLMTQTNGKWAVSLFNQLYEKRGSAYIQIGDYRRGIQDYQRIYRGMPNYAESVERWQPIGKSPTAGKYFIDVKASDVGSSSTTQFWIKATLPKSEKVSAFQLDCSKRRIRMESQINYDQNKNVVDSDTGGSWMPVTPDTLGEQLLDGACANP